MVLVVLGNQQVLRLARQFKKRVTAFFGLDVERYAGYIAEWNIQQVRNHLK
jgi:hypothetical protein